MQYRMEQDALGEVKVPADAYFGAFYARARVNFQVSGLTAPYVFMKALGICKKAACQANFQLGKLSGKSGKAIEQACDEFIKGKFEKDFDLDVFQAGAGTPYNMNANEVIANRANEILGAKKGSYKHVHPNDDVNMSQSSNDVIPTAIRLAILFDVSSLAAELSDLANEFVSRGKEFSGILKVGRTHLQDALPIDFGQEFSAWAAMIERCRKGIERAADELRELPIGGTALGTGLNSHKDYQMTVIAKLVKLTGLSLKSGKNLFELISGAAPFLNFSSSLRTLATDFVKIVNDLKLLGMGPKAGIAELKIPKVQPGSSIIPAKVNPSILECVEMVCFQVMGNDHAVAQAAGRGQLELNVMTPLIMFDILWSMQLLESTCAMLRERCVAKIRVNEDRARELFEESHCVSTALTPVLGYAKVAELVKESLKTGKRLRDVILERRLLSKRELDRLLDPKSLSRP